MVCIHLTVTGPKLKRQYHSRAEHNRHGQYVKGIVRPAQQHSEGGGREKNANCLPAHHCPLSGRSGSEWAAAVPQPARSSPDHTPPGPGTWAVPNPWPAEVGG